MILAIKPATIFLRKIGKKLIFVAKISVGLPIKNLGIIRYPLLQLRAVLELTRLDSTATSQAEFPPPITKTFWPAKGAAFL